MPVDGLPARIAGRYVPLRLLGKGGMGRVYEVEHLHTGEHLAMKVLVPQSPRSVTSVERFRREARASGLIKSEHVVRVIDADVLDEPDGRAFIVMELLEGTDLERLAPNAARKPEDVVEWLRQVARALDRAHSIGIIHRDLKPENIFLTSREDGGPHVKVLDFGIAKFASEGASATTEGQIIGTPMYLSPEQVHGGSADLTPASDRFALGLIAHKLLTDRHYFANRSIPQIVKELLLAELEPPSRRGSTLGPSFDAWFARACASSPDARFPSASAQIEALASAVGLPARPLVSTPARGRVEVAALSSPPPTSPMATTSEPPSVSDLTRPDISRSAATRTLHEAAKAVPEPRRALTLWTAGLVVALALAASLTMKWRARGDGAFPLDATGSVVPAPAPRCAVATQLAAADMPAECSRCLEESCCAQASACASDSDCVSAIRCARAGLAESQGIACQVAAPESAMYAALRECATRSCSSSCAIPGIVSSHAEASTPAPTTSAVSAASVRARPVRAPTSLAASGTSSATAKPAISVDPLGEQK